MNGIRLFRGITPSAIGIDVHGRYGETWTTNRSYAQGYARPPHGYVMAAILHPSAKRLVLVTELVIGTSEGAAIRVTDAQ